MENTEYFSLPDFPENRSSGSTSNNSSSEYHSDNNNEPNNQDSGSYSLPPTNSSHANLATSPTQRKVYYGYHKSPAPLPPKNKNLLVEDSAAVARALRKALVIYDYNKKSSTEVSLEKSQIVNILDAKPGAEWWRVKDELGRIGYYPSHYLRMI